MQLTSEFGTDWWNDSNDHSELQHAVDEGAVGATSNPVITKASVAAHPDVWLPVIDRLINVRVVPSEERGLEEENERDTEPTSINIENLSVFENTTEVVVLKSPILQHSN